jgi:uncharacterized protein
VPHVNPPDDVLRRLLTESTTIAMVGASSDPAKPSHAIFGKLKLAGYRVVPVNPNESAVFGEPAYDSLEDIPYHVDIVDVFRRAEETPAIADSAIKIGAGALWLQVGISNEDAARRAKAAGLIVVMDKCIAVTHAALGVPTKSLPRT